MLSEIECEQAVTPNPYGTRFRACELVALANPANLDSAGTSIPLNRNVPPALTRANSPTLAYSVLPHLKREPLRPPLRWAIICHVHPTLTRRGVGVCVLATCPSSTVPRTLHLAEGGVVKVVVWFRKCESS